MLVAVLQLLIPCQLSVILNSCQPSFVMSVSNILLLISHIVEYSFEDKKGGGDY